MRQRWLGLGLTIGLLVFSYGYGVAGLTEPYIAEGVGAMIQYDQAAARLRALQGAFREALEQAVTDMVDTSTLVSSHWQALRTRVYAKPLQYVVSYRVLWEYPDPPQKVYRVGVEAEITVSELSHTLDVIGLAARRREDSRRIVIFMAERYPGQTSLTFAASRGVVADVLRKELQDQGLRVRPLDPGRLWDGQVASALAVGNQLNAKIVLTGWAEVGPEQPEGTDGAPGSIQAKVEVKAFAPETSEEIAQAQVEATVPPAAGTQGEAEALAQAATEIAERLIPSLSAYRSGR
jgi:hypothetical protein